MAMISKTIDNKEKGKTKRGAPYAISPALMAVTVPFTVANDP